MKGFIQRLALLIHWIGFALFVGGLVIALFQIVLGQDVIAWSASIIGLFLWVLKWLISGNKSLWPWQS